LQNRTKHHAKKFGKKVSILYFGFWPQEAKKSQKAKKTITRSMKNLAFWMELNTPIKILVFYISSFQSTWYFVFCIPWGTKHSLSDCKRIGKKLTEFDI
jgi:hypothetical protein